MFENIDLNIQARSISGRIFCFLISTNHCPFHSSKYKNIYNGYYEALGSHIQFFNLTRYRWCMPLNVRFIFRKYTELFVHIQQVVVGVRLKLRKLNFPSFPARNLKKNYHDCFCICFLLRHHIFRVNLCRTKLH